MYKCLSPNSVWYFMFPRKSYRVLFIMFLSSQYLFLKHILKHIVHLGYCNNFVIIKKAAMKSLQ